MSAPAPIAPTPAVAQATLATTPGGLVAGQVLRASVIRAADGVADLLLRGQVVPLRTDLDLVPGVEIIVRVGAVSPGGISLSLMPERAAPVAVATASIHALREADLADLAGALRLPAGDRTSAVLRELMANGRALSAGNVQQVLQALRQVGGEHTTMLRPLVWLLARGLPVTPGALALAAHALGRGGPMPAPNAPGALPAGQVAGQALAAEAALGRARADLPPEAQPAVQRLRAAMRALGLTATPAEPIAPGALARQLAGLAEHAGTPLEAKLARYLTRGAGPAPEKGPGGALATTARAGLALPEGAADLRQAAAEARAALESAATPRAAAARHAAALEAVTTLTGGLEFAQLTNAARGEAADGRQTVWLPLPPPPGADGQAPTLAVTRWGGDEERGGPRRVRASLSLTLQHLGPLAVHLDLAAGHLRCEICAGPGGLEVVQPALTDLDARLASLGFHTRTTARPVEALDTPPVAAPPARRLDQRA